MISVETNLTAQFYDLDPMGVVWHGNYARFLEQARCDLLDSIGYNYTEMQSSGYIWPIVDMRIKYIRPIRFQEKCVVIATLVEFANRLKIDYLIKGLVNGEVLTKAQTIQVAVDATTNELCLESPAVLVNKLKGKV